MLFFWLQKLATFKLSDIHVGHRHKTSQGDISFSGKLLHVTASKEKSKFTGLLEEKICSKIIDLIHSKFISTI